MKKKNLVSFGLIMGTIFFLSAANATAQNRSGAVAAPAFTLRPSVVLDLWENGGQGKYKDYVKLTNATSHRNISLNIYGYEEKSLKWILIGAGKLKGFCDFDTVNSSWRGKMKEFRWLAVHSPEGISFDAQALPNRNDIIITIFPTGNAALKPQSDNSAPAAAMKPSIIIDLWEKGGRGKYKDYVKLNNNTLRRNIMFNVYGYDQANNQWVIIGPAILDKYNDTDTVDSPWRGRMNEFRWLAIHSLDNISFDARTEIKHNDIMVMIMDQDSGDWEQETMNGEQATPPFHFSLIMLYSRHESKQTNFWDSFQWEEGLSVHPESG